MPTRGLRRLAQFANALSNVGALLGSLIMGVLFVLGLWIITRAIWWNRTTWWRGPDSAADPHQLIVGVLNGLELLFLAPLPALVFLSLARFVESFGTPGDDDAAARADLQLHKVKALMIGLMIATIATDLLGKALEEVPISHIASESAVMLLLGLYWVVLQRRT